MSGMVINHFFTFNPTKGNIEFKYDGETLVKGETDGSSYPNGGLRATHTAGGYTSESQSLALPSSCDFTCVALRINRVFIFVY